MSKPNLTKQSLWVHSLLNLILLCIALPVFAAGGLLGPGQACSSSYDCKDGACIKSDPDAVGHCAIYIKPSVGVGDFKKGELKTITNSTIGEFIAAIYKYAIGIVGILSTVVMMIGGFIWISSGGSASRVGEAKAWIGGALTGLVLTLSSWMIINTINPNTTNFKPLNIKTIDKINIGCCSTNSDNIVFESTDSECLKYGYTFFKNYEKINGHCTLPQPKWCYGCAITGNARYDCWERPEELSIPNCQENNIPGLKTKWYGTDKTGCMDAEKQKLQLIGCKE